MAKKDSLQHRAENGLLWFDSQRFRLQKRFEFDTGYRRAVGSFNEAFDNVVLAKSVLHLINYYRDISPIQQPLVDLNKHAGSFARYNCPDLRELFGKRFVPFYDVFSRFETFGEDRLAGNTILMVFADSLDPPLTKILTNSFYDGMSAGEVIQYVRKKVPRGVPDSEIVEFASNIGGQKFVCHRPFVEMVTSDEMAQYIDAVDAGDEATKNKLYAFAYLCDRKALTLASDVLFGSFRGAGAHEVFYDESGLHFGMHVEGSDNTELLLMECNLFLDVVASNNEPIAAEDLNKLPFDRTFLELAEPIKIDAGGVEIPIVAVAFYRDAAIGLFSVIWYHDNDHSLAAQKLTKLTPTTGCTVCTFANGLPARLSSSAIPEVAETVDWFLCASRNVWDFVTCRNIDYDVKTRSKIKLNNQNRPKHLRGRGSLKGRRYRKIKVNNRYPKAKGGDSAKWNIDYQYNVPGKFHKYVHCNDCGKMHRKDLIGQPCRQCQKQVGPFSNVDLRKWWHAPYTAGPPDAPFVEHAREVVKS
jgi:hypothetical protein